MTGAVVREALRGGRDHVMAYYDAQIWAAARLAQAPYVLSEDFAAGSRVEGVEFVDPFHDAQSVLEPFGLADHAAAERHDGAGG